MNDTRADLVRLFSELERRLKQNTLDDLNRDLKARMSDQQFMLQKLSENVNNAITSMKQGQKPGLDSAIVPGLVKKMHGRGKNFLSETRFRKSTIKHAVQIT